jgi:hypothetical protein
MAEITDADLGNDNWTTTEQVQDRIRLKIQGENPDFEDAISDATDEVQSWWADATGGDVPDDLPDTVPDLLQSATAYLAASDAHLKFARNVRSTREGGDSDGRHVFLEQKAKKKFEAWKTTADLDIGDSARERSDRIGAETGDLDPLGNL